MTKYRGLTAEICCSGCKERWTDAVHGNYCDHEDVRDLPIDERALGIIGEQPVTCCPLYAESTTLCPHCLDKGKQTKLCYTDEPQGHHAEYVCPVCALHANEDEMLAEVLDRLDGVGTDALSAIMLEYLQANPAPPHSERMITPTPNFDEVA